MIYNDGLRIIHYRKMLLGLANNPNGFDLFEYVLKHIGTFNIVRNLKEDIFDEIVSFNDIYEKNTNNIFIIHKI
jgi:hypothetical protein